MQFMLYTNCQLCIWADVVNYSITDVIVEWYMDALI